MTGVCFCFFFCLKIACESQNRGNCLEKALFFHEDMTCIEDEQRKYPQEWHRGKTWHSKGTDNHQIERIFKRWRTQWRDSMG